MRSPTSKGISVGLSAAGLCAILMLPGFAVAAASSCRSASAPGADQAALEQGEYSQQEGEYLRLHREVMAPVLFRDLEQAAEPLPAGAERRAEGDRFGHPCESQIGERTKAVVETTSARGSRS